MNELEYQEEEERFLNEMSHVDDGDDDSGNLGDVALKMKEERERRKKLTEIENMKQLKKNEELLLIKKRQFVREVETIIKNLDVEFTFKKDLSSFERRLVHELAEKHGLYHNSDGELGSRQITISTLPLINNDKEDDLQFNLDDNVVNDVVTDNLTQQLKKTVITKRSRSSKTVTPLKMTLRKRN